MNLTTLAITGLIIYLLLRTLAPWLKEQIIIAKTIADNNGEAPDLDKAVSDLIDTIKENKEDECKRKRSL